MGRPRKQPARILTANIPLTTWDDLDALRLTNRSVWLNRVILDEIERESTGKDLHAARATLLKQQNDMMDDPAQQIHRIPTSRLAGALLSRIPEDKKRLRSDLVRLIRDLNGRDSQ